jgi:hypothetical protein
MNSKATGALLIMASLLETPAVASQIDIEIQHLLDATGESGCSFVRNGKVHEAAEAESHLRMKYRKGKHAIDSAEQFIHRIASKSSWTNKPYYIDCPGSGRLPAGDWLAAQLDAYRGQ